MSPTISIVLGSDHAGFELKEHLKAQLAKEYGNFPLVDMGPSSVQSVDYPDFAFKVAEKVSSDKNALGILICGSGIGMAISANKVKGIRASVVWDVSSARLSRQHNDLNILCLGARLTGKQVAWDAIHAWLSASFEKGRHQSRIDKILERENTKWH